MEAIFRRRGVFGWTVVVILGLVVAATLRMPRVYEADARLQVQDLQPSSNRGQASIAAGIASQVDLLQSQRVLRRAVGVAAQNPTRGQEAAAQALERRLIAEPASSDRIDVRVLAGSPDEAVRELRSVITAFFEERAAGGTSDGTAGFFAGQLQDKTRELEEAQRKLTDFEVQHGISGLDDQKKLETDRIASLQDQALTLQAQLAALRSKVTADKHELSLTPAHSPGAQHTVTNPPAQERLGTELVALVNRRADLLKRYPAADPRVAEVNQKIAETQKAIAAAGNAASGTAADVNPVYQQLSAAVTNTTAEANAQGAQLDALTAELHSEQARLKDLEEATPTDNQLKLDLAQAQMNYTLYARRSDGLSEARLFDVSLEYPPRAISTPVRPQPVLYIGTGAVLAVLLATLLALYADSRDTRIYTPAQLEALNGQRPLATIFEDDQPAADDANPLAFRRMLLGIREALREKDGAGGGYCVAFVSALRDEGTSYIASHLATEVARQASSRVAVLDLGRLFKKFEAEQDAGFALKYDRSREHFVLDLSRADERAAPLRGASHSLFAARLRPLLIEARREFDFIFLDCPSVQASTLAAELDGSVDGYVAVVAAAGSRRQDVQTLNVLFDHTATLLLGFVLNRRQSALPRWMSSSNTRDI
jgi:uncharacterized protein involved in exopolysaccharide biosynthesis